MLSTIVVPADRRGGSTSFTPLVRTLAALVPATVAGTVRDVTVLRIGRSDDAASIADEAGCRLVEAEDFGGAMRLCVASVRASWVLVLQAGAAPGRDFGDDIVDAFEGASGEPRRALRLREDPSGLRRLLPGLAPIAGVIAPRHRLEGPLLRNFADVLRRAGPARTLRTRVAVVS